MSRLRLTSLVVDGADDAAAGVVSRTLAAVEPDEYVLAFGKAAGIAGRLVREEREAQEGRWLDAAAGWLLAGQAVGDPPRRPGASGAGARVVAVGRSSLDAGGLGVCERFLELVGGVVVVAVASEQLIDDVDNAHLWLVGDRPFSVDTGQGRAGGRAVVGVGDGVVSVLVDGQQAVITRRGGPDQEPIVVALGGANKMSVRGASP